MTKEEVLKFLIDLFPDFLKAWESDDNYFRNEDGSYTYHGIFSEFSSFFRENMHKLSDEQLKELFSHVEKWEVKEPDSIHAELNDAQQLSNAVFTCFLEGIAGEGFTEKLKPFMGKKSLEYYSHYDYPVKG